MSTNLSPLGMIAEALAEINVFSQGEAIPPADAQFSLNKLNDRVDAWSAVKPFAFSKLFATYVLIANHGPHTIGPSGDFVVAQRPERLEGAMLILNNVNPNVNTPITVRDEEWWLTQPVPALTNYQPTDVYYEPTFPNGTLNFWPISTNPWPVLLESWGLISQFMGLNQALQMPPGYRNALTLTLAEDLRKPFGAPVDPDLTLRAARARSEIKALNVQPPRIATQDAGMPQADKNRTTFNYRSRNFG